MRKNVEKWILATPSFPNLFVLPFFVSLELLLQIPNKHTLQFAGCNLKQYL